MEIIQAALVLPDELWIAVFVQVVLTVRLRAVSVSKTWLRLINISVTSLTGVILKNKYDTSRLVLRFPFPLSLFDRTGFAPLG